MFRLEMRRLAIEERREVVLMEELVGNVPQLVGSDGLDAAVEALGTVVAVVVEEALGHA